MKKLMMMAVAAVVSLCATAQPKVYFTKEITPEALVKIYEALGHEATPDDDSKPLIERINRQHGTYITDYAEKIGLGSKAYTLVCIDK